MVASAPVVVVAAVLLLAGCSSLLPSSREATASPWKTYREAQLAFDRIVPGETTEEELKSMHLDPQINANIAILNYSDVLARFMPHASVSLEDLDDGVRDCLRAKTVCKGYEVSSSVVHKRREGNFVADILGFSRETRTTGWKFKGLVLIKGRLVIYKLTGGRPSIAEWEETNHPLGPVQSLTPRLLGY